MRGKAMSKSKTYIIASLITLAVLVVLAGCDLEPDPISGAALDGIVIYSGREILNGKEWEIVTTRVQQLRATGPSGHRIEWSSNNPSAIEVSDTGLLRVGRSPNKKATITATSAQDPELKAVVFFTTKGLR